MRIASAPPSPLLTRLVESATLAGEMAKLTRLQTVAIAAFGAMVATVGGIAMFGRDRMNDSERKRAWLVAIAKNEVGKTNPNEYWEKVFGSYPGRKYAWCGVFALWALQMAELTTQPWVTGVGFIGPLGLRMTEHPEPGDIAYFDANQHHAIVDHVNDDGTVELINGNGTGGAVSVSAPPVSSVTAFYSIQPLVS